MTEPREDQGYRRGSSAAARRVSPPANCTSTNEPPSNELVAALTGLDADRERALSNRTRRSVHEAAVDIREGRDQRRRNSAIALLILAGFLMFLSPAIWNAVDDLLGGEFLLDLPGMVAALVFTLFAAIAAVLFLVSGQSNRGLRHSRR